MSALFRVFGGSGGQCSAEACQHTRAVGMHRGEQLFLALAVPLSVFVATANLLGQWMHPVAAILLSFPAGFLLLNLLPCAVGGRTPVAQWRMWLGLLLLWAAFHHGAGGITGWVAWGWIGLFVLNAVAFVLWLCKRALSGSEKTSIAWRIFLLAGSHIAALGAGFIWGWGWAITGGALIAGVYCLAVLRPGSQWLGPVVCRTRDHRILVTIDDGPDPHDTPLLLDLLDQHAVKAVFFMIGEKVAAHPELAREVIARGHEIGNHTMTHPQASFWCAGPWRTRREISECQRVIKDATGVEARWFRAAVGHRNWFTHPVADALGLKVMGWSCRGFDAVSDNPEKVLARMLPGLGPGDIVLLHEGTPIALEVLGGVLKQCAPGQVGCR